MSPQAVAELGLEKEARKARASHSVGFNDAARNRAGIVSRITIGNIVVNDAPVVFFDKGAGYDDAGWGLRKGNAFFKDYVLTVDYQKGMITLATPK